MTKTPLSQAEAATPAKEKLVRWESPSTLGFFAIHLMCLGVIWTGVDARAIVLLLVTYWTRMFAITAGYHRYFSHRGYKTGRVFQFLLAFVGASSAQKGPLWWSGHHRIHHKYSDTPQDVHSPWFEGGFFWSHVGWILSPKWERSEPDMVKDWVKYPELVWLEKNKFLPPMLLAIATFFIGGATGLFWGFFVSTTILYHCTFTINSVMHRFGTQRYRTTDTSRNNWFFAFITMGEGWHNNHHYYPAAARQGFYWWEFDFSYYLLRVLAWLGLVWDLKEIPAQVRAAGHYATGEPRLYRMEIGALKAAAHRAAERASEAATQAAQAAREAGNHAALAASEKAHSAAEAASEAAHRAAESAREAGIRAVHTAHRAAQRWADTATEAAQRALVEASSFATQAELA